MPLLNPITAGTLDQMPSDEIVAADEETHSCLLLIALKMMPSSNLDLHSFSYL